MNSFHESPQSDATALIDRLVAGELTEVERRELLLSLESEPDGWRRCALAFLEDQAWRSALSGLAHEAVRPAPLPTLPSISRPRIGRRLAMVASILALTFAAGFGTGEISRARNAVGLAGRELSPASEPAKAAPEKPVREVGWIDLVDGSNGELPPRRLPIVSGPGLDEQWLRDQAPSVPDYVRASWERKGYHVQERRNLVSVVLEDGRRVSIPVDEVALDYVGQTPL